VDFSLTFDLGDLGVDEAFFYELLAADSSALGVSSTGLIPTVTADQITFDLSGITMPAGNTGYFTLGASTVVPEPAAILIWSLLGGLPFAVARRRRRG
jgi:hypothetical protein